MQLAIVGTGNMARAITRGLLANHVFQAPAITGTDNFKPSRDAFLALDPEGKLNWADSIPQAVAKADIVLISVKPQQIPDLFPELAQAKQNALYISIAAGVRLERLEKGLGAGRPIIRTMPNTPLLAGEGCTAYAADSGASEVHCQLVERIFGAAGLVFPVAEENLDAVTALSGSGPAFFAQILDWLVQAASAEGLPRELAYPMALQTMRGTARLLQETQMSPQELIKQVSSKGGTTEAGLGVLQGGDLAMQLGKTIRAAARRSRELANS
ncbi:MAG: pyrroline-5-carboxylate reductase [Methylacidiphilales bacterium]|nr:pyrroline-5-carboxylate reductase [Candidatus Methylacidiphilales bacterium]